MHICTDSDDLIEQLEETDKDDDDTVDFKAYMDVQPAPWSRQKRRKTVVQTSETSLEETATMTSNVVQSWRDDPSYVPLFKNESEKQEFENHLKSIDYTCVDTLFEQIEKKSKGQKNKGGAHNSISQYACVLCRKVQNSLSHIRLHCLIHTDLKPFTCPKCSFRSNIKGSLYTHMRTHTGNLFQCPQCSFQSTKRSHFLDHEQTHSAIPQCCKLCKNSYKTLKSLVFHIKKYHNNGGGRKYIKSLSSKQLNKFVIKCTICEKSFSSQLSLEAHRQQIHQSLTTTNGQEVSEKICDAIKDIDFNNLNDLSPPLLNCRVRLEPLDERLISYHQNSIKNNNCDPNFTLASNFESHNHGNSAMITSEQLNCRVSIKPLDDQLISYHQNKNKNICDQNFIQSNFESHKDHSHSATIMPDQMDCRVNIEQLDDQLISYHRNSIKNNICDPNFTSGSNFKSHNSHGNSATITSEQLDCRVSIKPLDDQLISYHQKRNRNICDPNFTQSNFESHKDHSHSVAITPKQMDCKVGIEQLDDQLISYHINRIKSNICDESFTSQSNLERHSGHSHSVPITPDQLEKQSIREKMPKNAFEDINISEPQIGSSSLLECTVRIEPLDDQLVEIMLNNLLQQKSTQPVQLFDSVFQQSSSPSLLNEDLSPETTADEFLPMSDISQFDISNSSILDECGKSLHINILDECLRKSNFTNEIITENSLQSPESSTPIKRHQPSSSYVLPELELNFTDSPLMPADISESSQMLSKGILQLGTELVEPNPEEIKLFEKCRRAPAYVCCVCSGIFICSSTLKAHLKEHVNKNSNTLIEQVEEFESSKLPNEESTLDNVCRMLQGSDVEKELEKLYTSSLDRMWYLPEVSVVLENDQTVIDAVLDDIANFPISDKFDESESLQLENEIFS